MSELLDLLNDENANQIADEVVAALEIEGVFGKSIEVDYEINKGVMARKPIEHPDVRKAIISLHGKELPSPNTSFSFNANKSTKLYYINSLICKLIEEKGITDFEYNSIMPFLEKIIHNLNSEDRKEKIRNILRKNVLGDADPVMFPIKDLTCMLFEFGSKEDYGDIIKIQKFARYNKLSGSFVGEKKSISEDLMLRRRQFGYCSDKSAREIYDTIVLAQKEAGNPLYDEILPEDVFIVKEAKECHLDIFADYSVLSKDEFEAMVSDFSNPSEPLT